MTEPNIAPDAVARIDAAQQKYAAALHRLHELRCSPALGSPTDAPPWLVAARRHVQEAFAEWVMLVEHETGQKLTALAPPVAAE